MNYIWEALIQAKRQGVEEHITFQIANSFSPYIEILLEDWNKKEISVHQEIEVNPYYRFYSIFKNYPKSDLLSSLILYYLAELDLPKKMTKSLCYRNCVRKEILGGTYGKAGVDYFQKLDKREQDIILQGILDLYKIGISIPFIKNVARQMFPSSIIYQDKEKQSKLYLYLGKKKEEKERNKINAIQYFFLPIQIQLDIYWEKHFCILGVEEVSQLEQINLKGKRGEKEYMFQSEYPLFEKGRLLKIEMLETIRDYPRNLVKIRLKNYQNGILEGCQVHADDKNLIIQPGIIYHDGIVYILKEEYKMPYQSNNRLTILKVNCMGSNRDKDFIRGMSRIYFDFNCASKEDEIELCRFQLREGARLRSEYTSFLDRSTEYDTINCIHAPYVGKSGITLAPDLIRSYAKEIIACNKSQPLDLIFGFMVLEKHGVVEAETIKAYLEQKGERCEKEWDNFSCYESLLHILQKLENPKKEKSRIRAMERGILLE